MEFDDLRRKFGAIIGESVPPGSLEQVLKSDRDGRFQQKQMISAIIAIYNYLEAQADAKMKPAPFIAQQTAAINDVGHNTQTIPAEKAVQPAE